MIISMNRDVGLCSRTLGEQTFKSYGARDSLLGIEVRMIECRHAFRTSVYRPI